MNEDNPQSNGENLETPAGSLPETTTAGEETTVNPQGAGTQSSEEASWNELSGAAQERFRQLSRKLNEAMVAKQAAEARAQVMGQVPQQTVSTSYLTPEQQLAVKTLDEKFNIATKDFVGKTVEDKINQNLSGLVYKLELDRIESKFDGSNGLPAFNRDEYEAFINTHPQYRGYQPEDVYEKMFPNELLQFRTQNLGKPQQRMSTTLKPNRTQVREEQWDIQAIERKLQEPDGPDWYDKNKSMVDAVVAKANQE